MLRVVTSVHNRIALVATCRELNVSKPKERSVRLDAGEVSGWVMRLPGLRYPVVFDLRTGLVAYHRLDNVFERYALLMRFIHTFYTVQARLNYAGLHGARKDCRSALVKEAVGHGQR
jgi:hypothetical protein